MNMGWNDHVDMVQMECLDCGAIDTWEMWSSTAIERYGGDLGKKLGHDVNNHNCCPYCGSSRGKAVDDEDDDYGA